MRKIIQILLLGCAAAAAGQTNSDNTVEKLTMEKIQETRASFNGLGRLYPRAGDVSISLDCISDVQCWWFRPQQDSIERVILYAHGGSYALGGIESHGAMVSHLASKTGCTILLADYALATEKPYPQGCEEFLRVYTTLVAHPATTVYMMGDSAGAGLIISALGALGPSQRQPAGVILLSPWIDLECRGASYIANSATDTILKRSELLAYADLYCGEGKPELCNPARIEFQQFPPSLIMAGEGEILADDSATLYASIAEIQPVSHLRYFQDVTHVWPLTDSDTPATECCWEEIRKFLETIR